MTRTEIINAHAATLATYYATLGQGRADRAAFAQWFWESICSQYSNEVIRIFLAGLGVSRPAMTEARLWAQFEALHA